MKEKSQEPKENRLKEALLVAKIMEEKRKQKRKVLKYDTRFIFKLRNSAKKAFKDYAKKKHTTGAKILRDYIDRLLGSAGTGIDKS